MIKDPLSQYSPEDLERARALLVGLAWGDYYVTRVAIVIHTIRAERAAEVQELEGQRDSAFYQIGDLCLQRNQAVTRAENAEWKLRAVTDDRDIEKAERDKTWLQAKALRERLEKAEAQIAGLTRREREVEEIVSTYDEDAHG